VTPQIDAVVFDYGGVLTTALRTSIEAWQAADGIDPASFTRVLKAWLSRDAPDGTPVHRLETGTLPAAEFDALLAAELRTVDSRAIDPVGLLSRMFAAMHPDPEMFALAAELREIGVGVALLSNSWGNSYPRSRLDALFDPVVISGEVGLRKPHAPIYELTLAGLGRPAHRVLFVDDALPNVEGARAAGLQGLLHTDPATTRAEIARLVPALRPVAEPLPAAGTAS
jgi:FMN phosphatase YigB (HAD superfamily)